MRRFPTPPLRQGIATSSRPRSQGLLTKVIGAATLSWFADILGATLGAEGAFSSLITLLQMLVAVAILSTLSSLPLSFLLSLVVVFAYKQGAPVRHIAIGAGDAKVRDLFRVLYILRAAIPARVALLGHSWCGGRNGRWAPIGARAAPFAIQ